MANRETKELFQFIVALVNATADSLKDGKIDIFDAFKFVKVLSLAGPAVNNLQGVLTEVAHWSAAEREEIQNLIKAIDLPDDAKEQTLEKVLQALVVMAELVLPKLAKA